MLLRLLGTVAIMVGSVGLGLYFSSREDFRARELLEFKRALLILSSEIDFMATPISMACANIAHRIEGEMANLFKDFASLLEKATGETASQIWDRALVAIKEKTFLSPEDQNMLKGFGKTLGYLDKQMQQNAINYTISYIDETLGAIQAKGAQTKRMYRSLGVIGGLLITIILW